MVHHHISDCPAAGAFETGAGVSASALPSDAEKPVSQARETVFTRVAPAA
jgi:hypothetical protein